MVIINTLTLGTVKPLSVGQHSVRLIWMFSVMQCDGIVANIDENCLPDGEFVYSSFTITVTAGH